MPDGKQSIGTIDSAILKNNRITIGTVVTVALFVIAMKIADVARYSKFEGTVETTVKNIEADISEIKSDVETLKNNVGQVKTEIAVHPTKSDITDLQTKFEKELKEFNSDLDQVEFFLAAKFKYKPNTRAPIKPTYKN